MENKNYYPKNEFEFEAGPMFFKFKPFKRITFDVGVEMLQDGAVTEDEYTEIISEKLKQDFKKFIKTKLI